ncbi:methyl-coenzyme M reductase-associated protein Mmp3 [Methanobacterium alcaliphilum]|uniref:methyl-coenzyme M reductase-associated protein Mmp3 n=1 Tax=Methanobacterium alcaliphilum TaxID=392018 RepID=UPI00200AB158|nr:methanogenesis marker 3 protein [Methanobacterium alcaliphilum]MCK9151251.1 methanogenesis marker 3 protein [Methanobacterium alcaliphilum]
MLVKVNGQEVELPESSTIKDAIQATNAPYMDGCVLSVIEGEKEFEKHINKYKIKTNKGSIIIEMTQEEDASKLVEVWKKNYKKFEGLKVRWITSNEVAMGPVKTDLEPTRQEFFYGDGDVILSLSGFTSEATHIILSKEDHSAVYGVPDFNKGVFARITGGRRTVFKLEDRDVVLSVEPVVERKTIVKSAAVTDINTPITQGNQIFTYVQVKPSLDSPQSVEHFFAMVEGGKIRIDYESNSFVGFYKLQGLEKSPELVDQRKRGTVTLRNSGKGMGRVFIYREDRVSTPSHSIIGEVQLGMQLLDIAKKGDYVTIKSDPGRIMSLSMTQKEAESYLTEYGVTQIREGLNDDDALVVVQEPKYTIDIIKDKNLKTHGIPKENLIEIQLNDDAPRSSWYFKKITGLLDAPIGVLKVHFAFPGMKVMMFEGQSKEAKGLIPENTPESCVKAGQLAITNMSRRHIGIIGVRFEDNDEFGPTGEPFNGTNIIGEIINGMGSLEKFKEGDLVYVTEKKV